MLVKLFPLRLANSAALLVVRSYSIRFRLMVAITEWNIQLYSKQRTVLCRVGSASVISAWRRLTDAANMRKTLRTQWEIINYGQSIFISIWSPAFLSIAVSVAASVDGVTFAGWVVMSTYIYRITPSHNFITARIYLFIHWSFDRYRTSMHNWHHFRTLGLVFMSSNTKLTPQYSTH